MNLSRRGCSASIASMTLGLAVFAGCGGPPPAAPAPAPSASASSTPVAAPGFVPLGTDTSAVPEPAALVVVGRVASVGKALRTLHGWSQLPMPKEDSITELLTSEAVGSLVDPEKSIDVAVAVTGTGDDIKPLVAFSAALADLGKAEETLQSHFKLTPDAGGTLHIDGLGPDTRPSSDDDGDGDDKKPKGDKPKDDENEQKRHCVLAPSAGDAPARLVCGISLASVHALGPWLARTLPRTPPASDLTIDVKMAPLKATLNDKKALVRAGLESALSFRAGGLGNVVGAVVGDAVDFASDLDSANLSIALGDDSATATLTTTVGGTSSTLSHMLTSHPERTDAPPAAFWQLPVDADLALFERGIDAGDIDGPRDAIVEAVTSGLSLGGAAPADAKAVADAIRKMITGSPLVYASGIDLGGVRRALTDQRRIDRGGYYSAVTPERLDARRGAAEALFGWRVIGVDTDAKVLTGAARDLAAAWARPGIGKMLRERHKEGPLTTIRVVGAPKGASLPAGSVHLEIDTYPFEAPHRDDDKKAKPAPAPKPVAIHILFVPEGGRTWITIAASEQTAVDKATNVLAAAPDEKQLVKRQGLDALHSAKIGAGGFGTQVGSASTKYAGGAMTGRFYGAADYYDQIASEPHTGTTPLVFTVTAQPKGVSTTTLTFPKAAIEDFVAAFVHSVGGGDDGD